jgi:hypothetical protein
VSFDVHSAHRLTELVCVLKITNDCYRRQAPNFRERGWCWDENKWSVRWEKVGEGGRRRENRILLAH